MPESTNKELILWTSVAAALFIGFLFIIFILNPKESMSEVKVPKGNVVLYFTAEWCGPCKRLKPVMESVAQKSPKIKLVIADVEQNPKLSTKYKVTSLPSLYFLKDGVVVDELHGFQNEQVILEKVGKLVGPN